MGAKASQITSLTIVYLIVYSGADQRKHQSSASLTSVQGIHQWPVNFPHKGPVTRKMFPFDDVIMERKPSPLGSSTQSPCTFLMSGYTGLLAFGNRFWISTSHLGHHALQFTPNPVHPVHQYVTSHDRSTDSPTIIRLNLWCSPCY